MKYAPRQAACQEFFPLAEPYRSTALQSFSNASKIRLTSSSAFPQRMKFIRWGPHRAFHILGRNEFALRQGPRMAGALCGAKRRPPLRGGEESD